MKRCDHECGERRQKAQDKRQTDRENLASLDQSVRGKQRGTKKKDRKRILGEQLNDALKKGEAREAHCLSRMLPGRGMGARRRHLSRIPAIRQSSWERPKTLEHPIDKGGCNGLRIIFSCEVESMKERSDLIFLWIKTRCCRDTGTEHACNLRCGSSGTGERLLRGTYLQNS